MFGYEDELRGRIDSIKENSVPKDKIREVLLGYLNNPFWVGCYKGGDSEASVLFHELNEIAAKLGVDLTVEPTDTD